MLLLQNEELKKVAESLANAEFKGDLRKHYDYLTRVIYLFLESVDKIEQRLSTLLGEGAFVHTQSSAATVWTVNHGLGKFPAVTILNSTGEEIATKVVHDDDDNTSIHFGSAVTGKAIFN